MGKTTIRITFAVLAFAYVLTHFVGHAHAQSSLGIGANEAVLPSTGWFAGILNWVNTQQQEFYRALTGALRGMREDGNQLWLLIGLSFAYGVFHAAGPGHGKAVISSYMLANEVALRRGIVLSFISAFLQAASAIVMIGLVFLVLRGTSVSMTDATRFLEVASYALIAAFGAWLLWKKAMPHLRNRFAGAPVRSLSAAVAAPDHRHAPHRHDHVHGPDCGHDHHHDDHHHDHNAGHDVHAHAAHDHHDGHHHRHAADEVCATCGHAHAPDPKLLSGDRFDWRSAWTAVAAVGIRPCTGALIVLTFSLLNGLWLGGIASVFAMALGTAITVSILATLAVTAKNVAVVYAGGGRTGNLVHHGIEIAGAAFVLLIGVTLLASSLSA